MNYSRVIGGAMMMMKKPFNSKVPSGRAREGSPDEISRKRKLATAKKYFRGSPDFLRNIWEFIGKIPRSGGGQGGHKPTHRCLPWWRSGCLWAPWSPPGLAQKAHGLLPVGEKIISGFFFRLDSIPKSDLKRVKNTEKTGTGTWH